MNAATVSLRAPAQEAEQFALVGATLDMECALLGALLAEPAALAQSDRLSGADFYEGESGLHARLLAALRDERERGIEAGLAAMQGRFGPELAAHQSPAYLADMVDKAPPITALLGLTAQIAAGASQRRLSRLLARPGLSPDHLQDIVQSEARILDAVTARGRSLKATPFTWIDPANVPVRDWLYDHHLIRQFVSATFAAGGSGKTTLLIAEALAMVTGKPLLGVRPSHPLTVWLVNLEDPREEIERRVAAACRHFGLTEQDIGGRLFIDSGRDADLVIAKAGRGGVEVCTPCVRQLEREIADRGVDVLVVDPFVAAHEVSENDNGAINVVTKQFASIADKTGCAIELIHHVRKPSAGQTELSVEDGRGASALLAGVRSARVINGMSEQQATEWGIEKRRSFIRIDNGKANLAPPPDKANWRRLVSVDLENGPVGRSDLVAVATPWCPPNPFDDVQATDTHAVQQAVLKGHYRASEQASAWVGHAVADQLGWDSSDPRDKARIKALLKTWLATGVLKVEQQMDNTKRELKPFVVVGNWVQT